LPSVTPQDRSDFAALQGGEDRALDRLIARWERPLLAFAWRYLRNTEDARDLVAETFVRLYRQRERLRADTNLSAWLFTTLANLCRNQHRWRKRHPTTSLESTGSGADGLTTPVIEPVENTASPDAALLQKEAWQALEAAINQLPHELKTSLFLYHFDHLSYREIGDITGCQARGVETRLYRAKQALRQALGSRLPKVEGAETPNGSSPR
jgi:RNA polymerase sigma factor (sigma-70 family)